MKWIQFTEFCKLAHVKKKKKRLKHTFLKQQGNIMTSQSESSSDKIKGNQMKYIKGKYKNCITYKNVGWKCILRLATRNWLLSSGWSYQDIAPLLC